jgi:hypothetical protein
MLHQKALICFGFPLFILQLGCKVNNGLDVSKHNLPRSISFGEINLELDDQGEDMYEFFFIQSCVTKRNPMLENSYGMIDHSPSFTEQVLSQLRNKHVGVYCEPYQHNRVR